MDIHFEFVEEKVLFMDLELCERISVCCDAYCNCEPTNSNQKSNSKITLWQIWNNRCYHHQHHHLYHRRRRCRRRRCKKAQREQWKFNPFYWFLYYVSQIDPSSYHRVFPSLNRSTWGERHTEHCWYWFGFVCHAPRQRGLLRLARIFIRKQKKSLFAFNYKTYQK